MTAWIGTFAYGTTAGAYAAFAFVLLLMASRSRRDRIAVPMALFAGTASASVVVTVAMQKAESIDDYAGLFKAFGFVGLVLMVTIVAVIDAWTGFVRPAERRVFLVGSAVIAVLQLGLPNGLLAGEISGLRPVTLFGEDFVVHEATSSAWRPVLDVWLVGTSALIIAALVRRARHGSRYGVFGVCCGLLVFVGFNGYDSLVDQGVVDTPYLMPFGFVVALAWLAVHVADVIEASQRNLEEQAISLEETVATRTAALLDANEEIRVQLIRQRENAAHLAGLADRLERVNLDVLGHDAHRRLAPEIEGVLASVASLLRADAVRIDLDRAIGPDRVARELIGSTDPGDVELPAVPVARAPVRLGTRTIGSVSVFRVSGRPLDDEATGHLELASELVAGVLHRIEMADDLQAAAVDVERQRIARELHDSVSQRLYSASFLADASAKLADTDATRASEAVRQVRTLILVSLAELRVLLFELQPASLADEPIADLIRQLGDMAETTSDATVATTVDHDDDLPIEVKTVFYRIAQETVSNAARHSGAEVITVEFERTGDRTTMVIEDDGSGFDPDSNGRGHGLRNVVDRAEQVGAVLDLDSVVGRGTRISVAWQGDPVVETETAVEESE